MSLNRANRDTLGEVSIPNVMLKTLFRDDGCINFCQLNVSSVKPKIDELRSVFRNVNAHGISFSETWFKGYNSNKSVEIEGYKLIRSDRRLRRSGGVALYLKDDMKYRFLASSEYKYDLPPAERFMVDYLLIELVFPDIKILYGVFYKAIKTNEFDIISDVITKYANDYEHVVFAGDFNENLLDEAKRNRMNEFRNVFSSNGLNILNSLPTNFHGNGASLLDLFIARNVENVRRIDQLDTGMSQHDILVMSYYSPSTVTQNHQKMYRDLKSIDEDALFTDTCLLPWENILLLEDSDSMVAALVENFKFLLDKHAPMKPVRERLKRNAPWFTKEISLGIIERDIAKRYWRIVRTSEAHLHYRTLRNKVTALITKAKASYYNNIFQNCKDSKSVWNKLRNLGIGKDKSSLAPPFTADEFNRFLSNLQNVGFSNAGVASSTHSTSVNTRHVPAPFTFHRVDLDVTRKSIMQVTSKAVGLDEIPISFIKMTLPVTLPYIDHMFNTVLTSSLYPDAYKKSKVFPVHKKSTKFEMKDHRGVHVLPALSKSLEKIMKWQITEHVNGNDLLYKFQSGYRPKYSTTTALLKVTQDIRFNLHKRVVGKKFVSFLLLLDFSSAFDLVHHGLLLQKLRDNFFFSESAIELINTYLSGRCQAVMIDDYLSEYIQNNKGVPQGSVLGPLLFSLFINDLPDVLIHCKCHLFADDVQLYLHHDLYHFKEGVDLINADLNRIRSWAEANKLILNASKSKAIVISETEIDIKAPVLVENPILLNGEQIHYCRKAKVLGLWMNNRMTWTDQVSLILQRVYGGLRSLWNCGPFLQHNKRVMLVKTLLLPHFTYCDSVMCDMDADSKHKLQVAMNACVRFAFNLKRRDHISTQEVSVLGCSYPNFRKYKLCLMLRSILISKQPDYLYEHLKLARSVRNPSLILPYAIRSVLRDSFFTQVVSLWNLLPLDLKRKMSSVSFPNECLQYFSSLTSV